MVISVLERRGEIGLRRALGATRGHISVQFLAESALLAAIGGVFGPRDRRRRDRGVRGHQARAVRRAAVRAGRGAGRRLRDRRARRPVPGDEGRAAQPDRGAAGLARDRLVAGVELLDGALGVLVAGTRVGRLGRRRPRGRVGQLLLDGPQRRFGGLDLGLEPGLGLSAFAVGGLGRLPRAWGSLSVAAGFGSRRPASRSSRTRRYSGQPPT